MFKFASAFTALVAFAAVSAAAPAMAAVKIAPSLELELPDFMPELNKNAIFVLDERADWPVVR